MDKRILHLVPEHIQCFQPYLPCQPDSELCQRYGIDRLVRLNNNENLLGPAPEVKRALSAAVCGQIPIYPSGDSYYLREALSLRFGKAADQFLVGNGSNELIACIIKSVCEKGDNIVTADCTYAVYEWVATFSGLSSRLVPVETDFSLDPEAVLRAMDRHTKIVFLCNPNNPTGKYWDKCTLTAFLDRVEGRCVVVLDEAYFEYVEQDDYPDGMRLIDRYPNVVVLRTFSKMFGLASLRVGYIAAAPTLLSMIRKTYVVYSVNSLAQLAAQEALLHYKQLIYDTRRMVRRGKEQLVGICRQYGFRTLVGEGNFMVIEVPLPDTELYEKLLARGFLIRTMTNFRMPGWIRVSLQPEPAMEQFCHAFSSVFSEVAV